ncbi:MAG: protein DA1 [Candidatus Marinimicrobia bacterium]|nr:protein DA1 [Candidatus Neomarinimicrobiota bacterium]MBL7022710.1 protein DA1 [Candidatus Neomarinimicrobiota bacterium]MBL7109161.1 protein DA1 [Candidatus Neomarinimicrobiota bacterium]
MKQKTILFLLIVNFISSTYCYGKELNCYICKTKITDEYVQIENNKAHPLCFICGFCNNPITSKYTFYEDKNYHESCYKNNILSKCDVCLLPIEHKYFEDAWGNKYHSKHESEGNFCNSCGRLISANITKGGFQFNDGRYICTPCAATMTETESSISSSRNFVIQQLSDKGFLDLPKDIKILLVDQHQLSKKSGELHHTELKGFTHIEIEYLNDIVVNINYTIYILFGLPKIEFEAVLSHEYLHIWIQDNAIQMHSSLVEGVCNLGSMIIYEYYDTQFSKIQLENMMQDPSPDYGKSYRIMKNRLSDLGWRKLINSILN